MVIEIGVESAKVLAKYERAVRRARDLLEIEEQKRAIAAEAVFAGMDVRGRIKAIDEVAGTVTTEED